MYLSRVEYYSINGGSAPVSHILSEELTERLCTETNVARDERSDYVYFAVFNDNHVPRGTNYCCIHGMYLYPQRRADVAEQTRLDAFKAYRKELYAKLTNSEGRKLVILPSHGRADNPDEMGPIGPNIYVDWIHFTYLSDMTYGLIENGEDNTYGDERPEARVMYLEDDCLVIDDGETKMYYGDFEIVPI